MKILILAAVSATVLSLPSVASAQACASIDGNLVKNCSFENPTLSAGANFPAAPLDDWTATPAGVVERWTSNFDGFAAKDGISHVELKVNQGTTLSQFLNVVAGTEYTLRFSAAHRVRGNNFSRIEAVFDGVSVFDTGELRTGFQWIDFETTFVAADNGGLLTFRSLGNDNTYGDHLDNVSVFASPLPAQQVPEPSSLALLALGAMATVGAARARRKV